MLKRTTPLVLALALALCGCAVPQETDSLFTDTVSPGEVVIQDEAVALAEGPAAMPGLPLPEAPGTLTRRSGKAVIDYSNTAEGYVMAIYTAATDKRLRVRVAGPGTVYTYDLPAGEWTSFPLTDGDGTYKVTVYENTTGTKYATVLAANFDAALRDEFGPFLLPNQYVDYAKAPDTLATAAGLTRGLNDPLSRVEAIYSYVVHNLTYDTQKASTVQSGYLPVLDDVLAARKGICFDYAALMAGMLRSQGVPCKLVVGYAGTAYHAWISVWTEEVGWIDGAIYFDGSSWHRMDPTFASSGKSSAAILNYIGDGSNYTSKYFY